MSNNDMKDRICALSKNDLKDLVKSYRIPLDLHSCFPDLEFTMDRLPSDAIGIYSEFLWFSGVHVPFLTFLLSVLKYFKLHISQLVPLGLNKVVSFEVVCRDLNIVPTVTLFRVFQCLCKQGDWFSFSKRRNIEDVYDLSSDGYDRNDVQRLCTRLIHLREMREEVLARSGLSSVWFNKECDPVFRRVDDNAEMSIYDFMTFPSWSDAKIVEESHYLSLALLERVPSHTTTPATKGAIIPLPTTDEIVESLPDSRLIKKSKGSSHASRLSKKKKLQKRDLEASFYAPELDQAEGTDEADLDDLCAKIEDSLKRDEGVSMRAISAPTPSLGKRLGAPPSIVVVSASEPSHVGTLAPAFTSSCSLSLGGVVASGCVGKSGAEVMRCQMDPLDCLARSALARDAKYDQIPDDDFGTATRGEEIDLTLFTLALGPYHMPYPYEGISSPLYTREEWNGPHALERSILCKDIFKDLNVCRKALDRTITLGELRRTESLLPLELSNHVNVLSALLVSHGYELNSHYANLDSSKAHLHEKLDKKKVDVKLLCSEVTSLDSKLENLQRGYDALGQENRELCSQRDAAFEEVKKPQSQLTDAKTTSTSLSEELTQTDANDEFHAALARVASLGINYGVERGLRMGHTDVGFVTAVQKVSNFHAASGGTLSDVAQMWPDKFIRSATSVFVAPSSVNEAPEQVPP
ncbi:hypothetical protein Tco_0087531 [Tanacetum coccineum]